MYIHRFLRDGGESENLREGEGKGRGALCVEMRICVDISWESRCNIEINV